MSARGDGLVLEFAGERHAVAPGAVFRVGRCGDVAIDDNPYLHRRFLRFESGFGAWWIVNEGARLAATVTAHDGRLQARLGPGARIAVPEGTTSVVFAAGPTTYEFLVLAGVPARDPDPPAGEATLDTTRLTASQRLLLVALAEDLLRQPDLGIAAVRSSREAAARLGWTVTAFTRCLDNLCAKLEREGVSGLRGHPRGLATHRRFRLVEHALGTGMLAPGDLALLPEPARPR